MEAQKIKGYVTCMICGKNLPVETNYSDYEVVVKEKGKVVVRGFICRDCFLKVVNYTQPIMEWNKLDEFLKNIY